MAIAYILFGWILSFFGVLSYDAAFINIILTGIFFLILDARDVVLVNLPQIRQSIEDVKSEIRSNN